MKIVSILKEHKKGEKRVILLPKHIRRLVNKGYCVLVEHNAGINMGIDDGEYRKMGANIVSREEAWNRADLIIKYKPPTKAEFKYIKNNLKIAALCHAESDFGLMKEFIKKKCTVFSFEFFKNKQGKFPLAVPGGIIAGKVAMIYALYLSQSQICGKGKLPIGINDTEATIIGVIGYGNVGNSIIDMAIKLGNKVIVFGTNKEKMAEYSTKYENENIEFCECKPDILEKKIKEIDILFGAILISTYGTKAIITEQMIDNMKKGSIIIDVTCGYGEGYMPFFDNKTSLQKPYYIKKGKIFVKIDNLPCAYHYTTTQAYSNCVAPYIERICDYLFEEKKDDCVINGMIFCSGKISHNIIQEHYTYYEENKL
jgi:alanine dehydrogenase